MRAGEIALFPLRTVLFPGSVLPLRVFETRYLDMIRNCLRNELPFGVVFIERGNETGPAEFADIGTIAAIVDWRQGRDGLLNVDVMGRSRFRIIDRAREPSGLYTGQVRELPSQRTPIDRQRHESLIHLAARLFPDVSSLDGAADDAEWLSFRLAEALPINVEVRQQLLACDTADRRLERISRLVGSLSVLGGDAE